jgi:hypothetical protein
MTVEGELERKLLWSGDEGYEQARRDAVWNGRKPSRRPVGIALAENAADVAAAVRLAKERGVQVSVRASGHSTSAAGLREGALLVDVSRIAGIDIDARARTAVVGPGVRGRDLDTVLDPLGLFFPHGHCSDVAVSGFLLNGGLGWNWRAYRPGCVLVRAVDVVTADGDVVRADESQNSDLYWAARGAGPGFFGIVIAFHLELQPPSPARPAARRASWRTRSAPGSGPRGCGCAVRGCRCTGGRRGSVWRRSDPAVTRPCGQRPSCTFLSAGGAWSARSSVMSKWTVRNGLASPTSAARAASSTSGNCRTRLSLTPKTASDSK